MYSLAQNFNRLLTIYTVNQILQSGIQILPQFGSNLVFQLYLLLNTPIHWPHANYTPLTSHLQLLFLIAVSIFLHLFFAPHLPKILFSSSMSDKILQPKPSSNLIFFTRRHPQFYQVTFLSPFLLHFHVTLCMPPFLLS